MNEDDPLPNFVRPISTAHGFRRVVNAALSYAIDSGWTHRTPLRTHVVICGFPRAGSTLLALMLQVAYRHAKAFPQERSALGVAFRTDRNHALLISKRPNDVFFLNTIRDAYARRPSNVRFLLTMRDPRAVLTSVHASRTDRYYVSPERWRATYDRITANRARVDCLVVRFEDMVSDLQNVQRAIATFIGEEPEVPFGQFLDYVPPGFRQTALNGLRPLDAGALLKWREPRYRDRIRFLLRDIPELPRVLIENGYEQDTAWIEDFVKDSRGTA